MNIALIAHDKKKSDMIIFVKEWETFLTNHNLWSTNTTGNLINDNTSLNVTCLKSGPLGGDQEVGSLIANQQLDMVIFFRDPLTSQPHEPDVSALIRLSDVYKIPTATNIKTATLLFKALTKE